MSNRLTERQERLWELLLVMGIAVLPGLLNAVFLFLGYFRIDTSGVNRDITFMLQISNQLMALALLLYVLYKQGRGLGSLGFSFSWRDLYRSLFLLFLVYICLLIFQFMLIVLSQLTGMQLDKMPQNIELFQGNFSLIVLLALVINSLFEELIVRAYFIREIEFFLKKTYLAVILCVLVQTSYHLYQGVFPLIKIALIFTIFSTYYVKKGRIMPLILAHTYINVISVLLSNLLK